MPDAISASGQTEASDTRDPIRDLVSRLNRDATTLATKDPELSRSVRFLAEAVDKPGRTENPIFRTSAAYALQDMERLGGPISTVPASLRDELTRLADAAPGLQNDRLQDLLRSTKSLPDMQLVRDIRSTAREVAAQGGDQNSQAITDRVEALENRSRLVVGSTAPAAEAGASKQGQPGSEPPNSSRSPAAGEKAAGRPTWEEHSGRGPVQEPPRTASRAAGDGAAPIQEAGARGPGAASVTLSAFAQHLVGEASQIRGQATSVVDRLARHGDQQQQRREDATIQGAERSQRAALDALEAFQRGPGSSILTKIQDAAKSEPGGMQAVLSEMREGGRFSSLRGQFNADLALERGMSAAYDRVASSLQQYTGDRAAVDAIGARRGTAQALESRFEKLDAEIGKATTAIPSRGDGKSVLDDLGERMREVLDRAVQAVRSAFNPGPRASSSPSPAP